MGLPYWDRLRRQHRRQREQTPRPLGGYAPLLFFLLAWFAAQAPVGEAAPIHRFQQKVESQADSANSGATWLEKAAAEVRRGWSILKARMVQPDLLQINNEVVLPSTAVAVVLYIVAAICILYRIKKDGKRLLHASSTSGGKAAKKPYVISILTGLIPGAGTTAEVLLRIRGNDEVASPYINISKVAKSMSLPNPVRRGEHTTLTLWLQDFLGPIESVEVKLHKCSEKTAWLLKYVKLTDPQTKLQYYACVNDWVQGTAVHSYRLLLPRFVSRWRRLQVSFNRAFSHHFIWSFWSGSRVSSMSSFASLSLCSLLALSIMSVCGVYLYVINQEIKLAQDGIIRLEGLSVQHKLTALRVMLEPGHLLVLLELIVTIAAIGWILEVLIRCVKKAKAKYRSVQKLPQPKGKRAKKLRHDKSCGTAKPTNNSLEKQPKINNLCKQKDDIDIRKMLENRVRDLLHDTSVYIKYSTSTVNQTEKSAQSQEGLNKKASCAMCKSKEQITKEHAPMALGSKTSKVIKFTAKEMVQTVMSEMENPPSKDSFPKLYKTISDKFTKMFREIKSTESPVTIPKTGWVPVKSQQGTNIFTRKASSDGKLIEKKSSILTNELGNNSDIAISNAKTGQQQPSPPGSALHKLINWIVADSVTNSVGYALGQIQEPAVTYCYHDTNKEKESGYSIDKKASTKASGCSIDKESTKASSCSMDKKESTKSSGHSIEKKASTKSSGCSIDKKVSTKVSGCSIDMKESAKGSSCSIDRKESTTISGCSIEKKASTKASGCSIDKKESAKGSSCSIDRKESTTISGCSIEKKASTKASGCSIDKKESTMASDCSIDKKESTQKIDCSIQKKESKNESGCSIEMQEKANQSSCSIDKKQSSKQLKREALMNKVSFSELKEEEVNTALSASMEAVTSPDQTATTKKAVDKAMKKAAIATAGKVLDVMGEVLQEPLLNAPKEVAAREMRRKVKHVIADQYNTVACIKKDLEAFAHVRQYVDTLTTNAFIRAKFLLSQGRGVQPEKIINTVSGQVLHQLAQTGSSTVVDMKRALRFENFQNQVVNAAVQKAMADLDTQLSANEKKQVGCCCDIMDRLHLEALEENFDKQDPQEVVARLAEELVQELTQQACQQVAQQLVGMDEDSSLAAMAEGYLLNPAAFGFLPSSNPALQVAQDVCTKVLARALLQTKEEMDKNACNNTSASSWSLMSALGLSNHNANTVYYQIKEEEVDINQSFTDAGATHWSELQLNQNHTVIHMDKNHCVLDVPLLPDKVSVLRYAARPPGPTEVDGALLDLDESLARPPQGCLPSAFIYLVYLLLLLLGVLVAAILVVYGGALPTTLALTWLVYVFVGLALHMLVLEPLKVLLVLVCSGTLF